MTTTPQRSLPQPHIPGRRRASAGNGPVALVPITAMRGAAADVIRPSDGFAQRFRAPLLHGHRLGEIAGFVHVATEKHGAPSAKALATSAPFLMPPETIS